MDQKKDLNSNHEIIDEQDGDRSRSAEEIRKNLLMKIKQVKKAKDVEEERANPNTTDSISSDNGLVLTPSKQESDPKGVFEIDYDKASGGRYSGNRSKEVLTKQLKTLSVEEKRKLREAKLKNN